MNLYEHTIIARQDTSPSEIKQLTEKYSKIVEKNDGEVVKTENWGLLNLSYLIKKIIGYRGEIKFDTSMPDGTMKKLIDSNLIKGSGWMPRISIESGINLAYKHFMLSDRK